MSRTITISFDELKDYEIIGIADETLMRVKRWIDHATKEQLRDLIDYFISEGTDQHLSLTCLTMSIKKMRQVCQDFLYSDDVSQVVELFVDAGIFSRFSIIVKGKTDKPIRMQVKNTTIKVKPISDDKLRQIAEDIYSGRIFCDRQIRDADITSCIFMPLTFMTRGQLWKLSKSDIGMIYEYIDKAGYVL